MKLVTYLFCQASMFVSADALAQSGPGSNGKSAPVDWFGGRPGEVQADIDSSIKVSRYSLVQVRQLLSKMEMVDQLYRDSLISVPSTDKRYTRYAAKIQANDKANQAILDKIVAFRGWPKLSEFGNDGVDAAWLIVWHAKRPYQERYFPLIEKAHHSGKIPDSHFTTLKKKLAPSH